MFFLFIVLPEYDGGVAGIAGSVALSAPQHQEKSGLHISNLRNTVGCRVKKNVKNVFN
jgi:hypothetical protein